MAGGDAAAHNESVIETLGDDRWVATIGIYGNSKQEAMYPIYQVDSAGEKLSGANRAPREMRSWPNSHGSTNNSSLASS